MGSAAFDAIVAHADPALIVVTAADQNVRAGCLVGFHSQSSIDPVRYSVWLSKANYTYRVALHATHLGLHFLTREQVRLAERFGTVSSDAIDKFSELDVALGSGGVPVLMACAQRVIAQRVTLLDEGGDHVCFVLEPIEASSSASFEPLRLSHATHLAPGHEA